VGGDGKQLADGRDDRVEALQEGMAAARRERRSGGASWRSASAMSRWKAERSVESRPGRRAPGEGEESAKGRSVPRSRGECVASAQSRTGKVAARSGDAGSVAVRKKESLEVGRSAGWRRMWRRTGAAAARRAATQIGCAVW
jgi:hypothetical protein